MEEEITKNIEQTVQEGARKTKSFFAGLDLYTAISIIAALVMAFFGNLMAVVDPFSIRWNFWICLLCAVAIGFTIYMQITKNKIGFRQFPQWMKFSIYIGVYVFVTTLFGFIRWMSAWSPLLRLP